MKYEAIAEQEVAVNWVTVIEEFFFALQTIIISKEEKCHYMILINCLKNMSFQFNSDKTLSVNFNTEIDDCVKDWSEIVVQQLSFAWISQTIIVLHRLFNKKKNIYKDELLKTILHNFKINEKFEVQYQKSDKMTVKIWIILQEKMLKH